MKGGTIKNIDLRSDTVTQPTAAMRQAMANAEVGDDVYGEDPTVNRLEALAAEMLGQEAALFVATGTQGNLLALLGHCQRGDEYIAGQRSHCYRAEGGGAAVLGGIQPQPLDFQDDGTLDLDQVAQAVKPDDFHFARTRLLCLENTQLGKVLPLEYLARARRLADEHRLALHLDGARVFNAAVKLGISADLITAPFDSVSVCLSKGLGAPAGSLLCGTPEFITAARRGRKMLGGGMRQSGVLAAAGVIALEQHVERLADDHCNAQRLAHGLAGIEELEVDPSAVQTNMAFVRVRSGDTASFCQRLREQNIIVPSANPMRLVTHLDVSDDDVDRVVDAARSFFASHIRKAG
jgi:threonine aldolase